MRRTVFALLFLIVVVFVQTVAARPLTPQSTATQAPFWIENVGQFDSAVQFLLFGGEEWVWIADDGIWISYYDVLSNEVVNSHVTSKDAPWQPEPFGQLETHVQFGTEQGLVVAPVWRGVQLSTDGDVLRGEDGFLLLEDGGTPRDWHWEGRAIGQQLPWDHNRPQATLSATPGNLLFSTLLGAPQQEFANGVTYDDDGAAYIAGTTYSLLFPSRVGRLAADQHGVDVYILKLTAAADALDYLLWVNPDSEDDEDSGNSIGLDSAGNSYIAGTTRSVEFCSFIVDPSLNPGFDTTFNGDEDAYLLSLDPGGNIRYCTFVGGLDIDRGQSLVVGPTGDAVVVGGTFSATGFPITAGAAQSVHAGVRDVFAVKVRSDGSLIYGTYFGGSNQDEAQSAELAADGSIVVSGWASSTDLPTTAGVVGGSSAGGFEAFVFRLNSTGAAFDWATYVGGSDEDRAYGVALDANENVFVTGSTRSNDFPVSGDAFDSTFSNNGFFDSDAYITQLNPTATALIYSSYLGGDGEDAAAAIAVQGEDNVYVIGYTDSADFPTTSDALSTTLSGPRDAFLFQLTVGESAATFSTFIGGTFEDEASDLAVRQDGVLFVSGRTRSTDFPTTSGAFDESANGDYDGFVLQIEAGPVPQAAAGPLYMPTIFSP